MRICIHCSFEGENEYFARKGEGYRNICKICHNKSKLKWSKENTEKKSESSHKSYAKKIGKNPEECRRVYLTGEEKSINKILSKKKEYQKNKQRYLERAKKRVAEKASEISEYQREWREKNKNKKSNQDKLWRQKNKAKVNIYSNARRFRKIQAMPSWLSAIQKAQIQEFYDISDAVSMQTGIKHHVDHIHPLHGKGFNGLHVPWNLQVISGSYNLSKGRSIPEFEQHLVWNL